jgi:TRAP-type C4-dicarboxylate transport system permease small subunit
MLVLAVLLGVGGGLLVTPAVRGEFAMDRQQLWWVAGAAVAGCLFVLLGVLVGSAAVLASMACR